MNRSPFITPIFRIESIFSKKKTLWDEINLVVHKKHLGLPNFTWSHETFISCDAWLNLFINNLEPHLASDFTLDINEPQNLNAILASLMTLCPWRYSQGCYTLNEEIYKQAISDTSGALISPKHFKYMTEWTTCIPLIDTEFDNRKVFNFYAHKTYLNLWPNSKSEPNCLIFTFNIDPEPTDLRLINKDRNFKPMPYVIFRADQLSLAENSILEFGAFPMEFHSMGDFINFIKPYLAIFNTIFDPSTQIESEFVGIKKPHYSDVQTNINFNDLNFPTIKHLAPSNSRIWQVGHNVFAKLKQRQRRESLDDLPKIKWVITDSDLQLYL